MEPKPIMTMGPEIFAWMGWSCGLINWSPEMGCIWCEAEDQAVRRFAVTFISNFIPGFNSPATTSKVAARPDIAKVLAADREHDVGILGIGDVIGRADNIGHRETAILQ